MPSNSAGRPGLGFADRADAPRPVPGAHPGGRVDDDLFTVDDELSTQEPN